MWPKGALLSSLTYLRKKAGLTMKSYRPVTLQQCLTKIVTGILARRLAEAIAQGAVLGYPHQVPTCGNLAP